MCMLSTEVLWCEQSDCAKCSRLHFSRSAHVAEIVINAVTPLHQHSVVLDVPIARAAISSSACVAV
eukprot:12765-Heterococcus_DN1.PRE.3